MTTFKFNREETKQHLSTSNKGAIITGPVGVGKTTLIRKPRMVTAPQLVAEFQLHGIEAVQALINNQVQYQNLCVVIDDLGTEETAKHYGDTIDPIAWVIQRIYDVNGYAEVPIKLYLTTNLDKKSLTERYGERVVSRIWEMCDPIVLQDTNLRILDPMKF